MDSSSDLHTLNNDLIDILLIELNRIAEDIKAKHIDLGMKASGDWLDSVEVVRMPSGGGILANDYTKYLVKGRTPGKMPPKLAIIQWLKDKFGYDEKTAEAIAYPVMKKIADEGTEYYKKGGTDLVSAILNDQRVEQIFKAIKAKFTQQLIMIINKEITA